MLNSALEISAQWSNDLVSLGDGYVVTVSIGTYPVHVEKLAGFDFLRCVERDVGLRNGNDSSATETRNAVALITQFVRTQGRGA